VGFVAIDQFSSSARSMGFSEEGVHVKLHGVGVHLFGAMVGVEERGGDLLPSFEVGSNGR
jgi:hypothetical protein